MLDLILEIGQTLRSNKLRTALTGLAVAWGIFMLIVLLGASRGLSNANALHNTMEESSYITVWGGRTSMPHKGYPEGRRIELEEADMNAVAEERCRLTGEATATVSVESGAISSEKEYITGNLNGVYPSIQITDGIDMTDGRFINTRDIQERRKVVVLSENNAKILFGSADGAVGRQVNCMGLVWKVAGVYASRHDRTTFAPFSTIMMLKGNTGRLNQMKVKLTGMENMDDVAEADKAVRGALGRQHDFSPDDESAVYLWNRFENYLQQKQGSRILDTVVWVIGLLTMLSGIVGVSNIMFVSVRERTHEIGIRRAIGAKPRSILTQVLAESVAITAIFGYAGVFAGILVTEVLDKAFGDSGVLHNPRVDISVAIEVTIVLIIVGALAGLFPAIKATKVKPVEALRDE